MVSKPSAFIQTGTVTVVPDMAVVAPRLITVSGTVKTATALLVLA
jgi:hypothetical protein